MSSFKTLVTAVTPTVEEIYKFANEEKQSREKFVTKLFNVMIEGAKTGLFDYNILDAQKNIESNLRQSLDPTPASTGLTNAMDYFLAQIAHFRKSIVGHSIFEEKALYGLESISLFYRNGRLTSGRLSQLFFDLNDLELDAEVHIEEIVDFDEKSMIIEDESTVRKQQQEAEKN